MKDKFIFLVKNSLKNKITSKGFIFTNFLVAILVIGFINLGSIIKFFGGDFNEIKVINVIDKTNVVTKDFSDILNKTASLITAEEKNKYKINAFNLEEEDLKKHISANKKEYGVIFSYDDSNYLKVTLITNETINSYEMQILQSSINAIKSNIAINKLSLNHETLARISKPVVVDRIILSDKKSNEENMEAFMSTIFPTIVLPIFMLITTLIGMISSEINQEKSSKSMEVILGNVSPEIHFASKILATNIFIILQIILFTIYSALGFLLNYLVNSNASSMTYISFFEKIMKNSGLYNQLYILIPFFLILTILTFVAYSLIAGILASVTTNAEDLQQMNMPLIFITFAGYYLAIMSPIFKGSLIIRILSYVPLISSILSSSLLLTKDIGILDISISVFVNMLFIFVVYKYGIRVYKNGILNYSSHNLWQKIFHSIKKSN